MKMILFVINPIVLVATLLTSVLRAETNTQNKVPPLPEPFWGITNTQVIPGLKPVALYRCISNTMSFSGVGNLIQSNTNEWSVILSEHMYLPNNSGEVTYAFRIARPDSQEVSGYLGDITMKSADFFGCDMAVAKVVSRPTPVKTFSKMDERGNLVICYSDVVTAKKLPVRKLRSSITGRSVRVLGYGLKSNPILLKFTTNTNNIGKAIDVGEERPLIAIDEPQLEGKSGTAFVDEYGRIFIISGAIKDMSEQHKSGILEFEKVFGFTPKGITLITGPIELDPVK